MKRNRSFLITGMVVSLPEQWLCHAGMVALKVRTGGSKSPGILTYLNLLYQKWRKPELAEQYKQKYIEAGR